MNISLVVRDVIVSCGVVSVGDSDVFEPPLQVVPRVAA